LYRPRWPLLLTLVLGVGAVIAWTALVREQPASEAEPKRGGVYVEGVAGVPSRINPIFATFNTVDADLSALVFSSLVRLGPKGGIEPDLAASWKVSPDGLTYVFQLRRGLYWHDGTPLDAEDVVFTIHLIQSSDFQGDPMLAELFREVEVSAPDPSTVQFRLSEPFAPFLAQGATSAGAAGAPLLPRRRRAPERAAGRRGGRRALPSRPHRR
jgi:ABC-type transport system substrate-binding protein